MINFEYLGQFIYIVLLMNSYPDIDMTQDQSVLLEKSVGATWPTQWCLFRGTVQTEDNRFYFANVLAAIELAS